MAVDQDSSDWVLILRWVFRVAAVLLVLHGITTLSSHPSVVYGAHDSEAAECPQVLTYSLKGTALPTDKSGHQALGARRACARVSTSDAKSSGAALGGAVVLVALSLIPWRNKKPPAPGWVKVDGKWYSPRAQRALAPDSHDPHDPDNESPPGLQSETHQTSDRDV